jgi:hypothetical protein
VTGDHASHEPLTNDWNKKQEGAYRVAWGAAYRLEVLALGRRSIFPRLESASSIDRTLLGRPVMVIGEEGAGLTSFFAMHKGKQNFRAYDFATGKSSDLNEILIGKRHPGPKSAISDQSSRQKIRPILLANLESSSASRDVIAQVRSLSEGFSDQTPLEVGVYFTGSDERVFDAGVYSEFSAISSVTRLPRFTLQEISGLLTKHLAKQKEFVAQVNAAAMALLRWTGGQPLLVQSLLAQIQSLDDLSQPKLMRRLRDHPPPLVLNWQRRLAQLLEDSKDKPNYTELSNHVRQLLKGESYPIDTEDSDLWAPMCLRPLCLAGWLSPGLSDDGKHRVWRFSDLHQFWAQSVVRHPKSFLIRSGGQ